MVAPRLREFMDEGSFTAIEDEPCAVGECSVLSCPPCVLIAVLAAAWFLIVLAVEVLL